MTRREEMIDAAEGLQESAMGLLDAIDVATTDEDTSPLVAVARSIGRAFVTAADVAAGLAKEVDDVTKQRNDARAAIQTLREYASKTHDHWDADEDMKVGKRLLAMGGHLSYDAAITAALKHGEEPE